MDKRFGGIRRAINARSILVALLVVLLMTLAAGIRWANEALEGDRNREEIDVDLEPLATFDPPIAFGGWSATGASDAHLKVNQTLAYKQVESLRGMSYVPSSMYGKDKGGLLLINPPSETRIGDGKTVYEGSNPWCLDEEGKTITVGEIGATFTFPSAATTREGSKCDMHVTLSNFKIKICDGAALTSSVDAASTGTGFTLGEGGVVKGLDPAHIINTAPASTGAVKRHALAEGQYIAAFGNLRFEDSIEILPSVFARPYLFNQCCLDAGEGQASWKAWDCSTDIDENGRLKEGSARTDTSLYNAAGGNADALDYSRFVALSFDVDVYLTIAGTDEKYDGRLILGIRDIDEPDRSDGSSGSYDGAFTESLTWRYGLTESPIIMHAWKWAYFTSDDEAGGADFSDVTLKTKMNYFVNLKTLIESKGKTFVATHEVGNPKTVDFSKPGYLKYYRKQVEAATHVAIVHSGGFGFSWCGSGAQATVLSRGVRPRRLTVENIGDFADKITVVDVERSAGDTGFDGKSAGLVTGAKTDGSIDTGPVTYYVPWKGVKTLRASADEGYHISGVYILEESKAKEIEESEDSEEEGDDEPSEESGYLCYVDVEKMEPGQTCFIKDTDYVSVYMLEDGSVLIRPTGISGEDEVTGQVLTGMVKDMVVRVEAAPN